MAEPVDLTACDWEPIRIPGAIQPHGVLLCIQGPDHRLVQYSANLPAWLGRAGDDLAGQPLPALLGPDLADALERALATGSVSEAPCLLGHFTLDSATGPCRVDAAVHRLQTTLILELEPSAMASPAHGLSIYPLVRLFVSRLQETDSLRELCQLAATEMRRITGFDRTMVYQFDADADGHGEVLGEDRDEALMSHLGQWFPASDIPRQARELYVLNRIRMIPTASYEPVPLVPPRLPGQAEPTDLSHAMLRSVSPVHLAYMRNMGTLASMSVSIVVRGRLWGLISCHHAQPRAVGFEVRAPVNTWGRSCRCRSRPSRTARTSTTGCSCAATW